MSINDKACWNRTVIVTYTIVLMLFICMGIQKII